MLLDEPLTSLDVVVAEEMKDILEACDRSKAGPTAEPQGLTLVEIRFV